MRFGYSYKSSDGVRHEAECAARNKEEVFERLRAEGIRAIKVWEIRSPYAVSKRTVVIVFLFVALGAALLALRHEHGEVLAGLQREVHVGADRDDKAPRRYFDPSMPRPAFAHSGEAFLLRFVSPAVPVAPVDEVTQRKIVADIKKHLVEAIPNRIGESRGESEIRAIVRALKQEIRDIVANGRTVEEALDYFAGRQEMEVEYRRRMADQVRRGEMDKAAANAIFRTMGFEELR